LKLCLCDPLPVVLAGEGVESVPALHAVRLQALRAERERLPVQGAETQVLRVVRPEQHPLRLR
jgi:hypothetical protein